MIAVKGPHNSLLVEPSLSWNVKVDQVVRAGFLLGHLTYREASFDSSLLSHILSTPVLNSKQHPIKAPISGKVKILKTLSEFQTEGVLCYLEQCSHEVTFGGMCANCGLSDEDIAAELHEQIECAVASSGLKLDEEVARGVERSKREQLLRARKLILVLDLDHTLLHTVPMMPDPPEGANVINVEGTNLLTKLRPHLDLFLKALKDNYELYVYTMGSRTYASAICDLLDPQEEYFAGRIFSKDDAVRGLKSLKKLLPFDDCMAIILDDTADVWQNSPNLVIAERFVYFSNDTNELEKLYTGDNDVLLYFMQQLLTQVHNEFFRSEAGDVKDIIARQKRSILSGCRILFSGLIPLETAPEASTFWRLAEDCGAECTTELDQRVTHVVAGRPGTNKVRKAMKKGIRVVHFTWMLLSASFWYCLPEAGFDLSRVNRLDVRSLIPLPLKRKLSSPGVSPRKRTDSNSSSSDSDFADLMT
mmetsp:Transcript_19100/g.34745  ORF Transcript_19100/g.34745 Transcript_19100/m.34745 type:complete len:475 (-) Transcript_19100:1391-2815(-)